MSAKRMSPADVTLLVVTIALMAVTHYLIISYAPIEREMGIVQKIFYYHVPTAWNAFLGFFIVFLCSFLYLATRKQGFDVWAEAAAEVGVIYTSLVLITGPIWAKPVWGVWWTWDARLSLTLVLWLIYAGYLMLRHYLDQSEKRATLSAVVGILGFVNVPLVYFAIRWWRTQHPQPVILGGEGSGLDPRMATTLYVSFFAFCALMILLIRWRARIGRLKIQVEQSRFDQGQ